MKKGVRRIPHLYFFGGLLIAIGSSVLNQMVPLPELLHALVFGLGTGLMLWGIYLMRKATK